VTITRLLILYAKTLHNGRKENVKKKTDRRQRQNKGQRKSNEYIKTGSSEMIKAEGNTYLL